MTRAGLIGAAILLWGRQRQLFYPALVMAAVVESHRFMKSRWDFSEADLRIPAAEATAIQTSDFFAFLRFRLTLWRQGFDRVKPASFRHRPSI